MLRPSLRNKWRRLQMSKPGLLNTGPMMDLINDGRSQGLRGLRPARGWRPRGAVRRRPAPTICALCTGGHTGVRTDAAMLDRHARPEDHRQFRRWLRHRRYCRGGAQRGIIITNTPEVLTEEVADTTIGLLLGTIREFYEAEKWLREGRWAKEGDYPPDRGLAARSLDRHHGHGPHRPGHRASPGGFRSADQLLGPQSQAGRRLSLL